MRERRKARRYGKRLSVRWGEAAFEHAGFTQDVSSSGMFVVSRALPEVGRRVHLQVQVTATQAVHFEGRVQRHKQAPRALQSVAPSGFGVSFIPLDELVADILPQLRAAPLELSCATVEEARRVLEDQLRRGGLFVATQATPARDEALTVVLRLPFADTDVVLDGRVMQVVPGAGVALQLERPEEAVASLEGMLG